jgi:LacI family transcriptional regulator
MQVTIKDIARALGLSPATVSLALNESPMVNPETAKRVKAEAQRVGYVPNQYARGLARGKSGMIALVVPEIRNDYFASLVGYATEASKQCGYDISIYISNESLEDEKRIFRKLLQQNVEAVILAPVDRPAEDMEYMGWLRDSSVPVVFASSRYEGVDEPCVMCDLHGGMVALTEHLCRQGLRRVALLTGPESVYTLDLRQAGYLETIARYGIRPEVHRVAHVGYQEAFHYAYMMENLPDALICVNDITALGALNAMIARGISVPGDIRIAGFDDCVYSQVAAVPLTTVCQDVRGIAERMLSMAKACIEDPRNQPADVIVPCRLIVRRSTAAPGAL